MHEWQDRDREHEADTERESDLVEGKHEGRALDERRHEGFGRFVDVAVNGEERIGGVPLDEIELPNAKACPPSRRDGRGASEIAAVSMSA
ncbi:MAG: hypothetical protein ACLQME_00870 [Alphaproteobacteria bacterium]